MKRSGIIIAILLLVAVFVFISQSIVRINLVELGFQLERDQLFNYELSSKMLRARFRSLMLQREDFRSEIKLNVLESTVLNFDRSSEKYPLGINEYTGLIIVNGVRTVTLKPTMTLQDDQALLDRLQYAFYLERMGSYGRAAEKYKDLEKRLATPGGEDHGFVLLHEGYCLALLGKNDEAIKTLQTAVDSYPGTRNGDDAQLLIKILLESNAKEKEIEKKYSNETDRGVALYRNGQYASALKRFKGRKLSLIEAYYRARSLEGVGKTKAAVSEYIKLVEQKIDPVVAKKANRRLLIIGSFRQGNKEVKKFAEENAKRIGDDKVLEEVKKGSDLIVKSRVIEKIKKAAQETDRKLTPEEREAIEEINNDIKEVAREEEKKTKEIAVRIKKAKPIVAVVKPRVIKIPEEITSIVIRFVDGRRIVGHALHFSEGFLTIFSGEYHNRVPFTVVQSMELIRKNPQKGSQAAIIFNFKDGTQRKALGLRRSGDDIIIRDGNEEIKLPEDYLTRAIPVVW